MEEARKKYPGPGELDEYGYRHLNNIDKPSFDSALDHIIKFFHDNDLSITLKDLFISKGVGKGEKFKTIDVMSISNLTNTNYHYSVMACDGKYGNVALVLRVLGNKKMTAYTVFCPMPKGGLASICHDWIKKSSKPSKEILGRQTVMIPEEWFIRLDNVREKIRKQTGKKWQRTDAMAYVCGLGLEMVESK